MKLHNVTLRVPELQADATLNQANPVSGTKYTVLATTNNVRVMSIQIETTWTVQPTPLEMHGIADSITLLWTQTNPVSATSYYANWKSNRDQSMNNMGLSTSEDWYNAFLLEARSILLQAEVTGGTVQNLSSRIKYGKW